MNVRAAEVASERVARAARDGGAPLGAPGAAGVLVGADADLVGGLGGDGEVGLLVVLAASGVALKRTPLLVLGTCRAGARAAAQGGASSSSNSPKCARETRDRAGWVRAVRSQVSFTTRPACKALCMSRPTHSRPSPPGR